MPQPKKKRVTSEEYFSLEESAEYKSEYYQGEIFAMTGASFNHNIIAMNVVSILHGSFHDSNCFVLAGDMRIQADKAKHYMYPDLSVVCGDIEFVDGRDDTIANPIVIFEILSDSTKDYDRGSKFTAYRNIHSLNDYILIDQYAYHVECFFKNEAGRWSLDEFKSLDDTFTINSIDIELSLNTIYYRAKL
jgi:Uma2 family endonuclease